MIPDKELKRATKQNIRNNTQPTNTALNMPSNNRGRRGAPAVNRGVAIGRAQTPVRARPVEDPILVIAQAITESQIVSNLHDTSSEHRNTIKQLKERIKDLTNQIKDKNKEISSYRGIEQKVASLQNKIDNMETPKKPSINELWSILRKTIKSDNPVDIALNFPKDILSIIVNTSKEAVVEELGFPDFQSLKIIVSLLKSKEVLKTDKKGEVSIHIQDTKDLKKQYYDNIKNAAKLGYISDFNPENGQVRWHEYVDKKGRILTPTIMSHVIVEQEAEIIALEKIIAEDDLKFKDC